MTSRCHLMSHNEFVCLSQSISKKGLLGKRTVQFGKRGRYVNGRYVNAQAFSLTMRLSVFLADQQIISKFNYNIR